MSPGSDVAPPRDVGTDAEQPQRPDRHHQRAERHRDPRSDPLAEGAAARGEEEHADGDRQGGQPGLEGVVATDGLQLQHEEEQDGAERGVDEQRHQVGRAEGAVVEEAERHHRPARAALDHHERDRRDQRPAGRPQRHRPSGIGQRPGEAGERERGERRPGDVEAPLRAWVARLGHPLVREPHGQDREREVDQEDPPPRRVVDEQPADQRSERRGDAAEARPGADGPAPVLRAERSLDHRQAAGCEERAADALQHPGRDQHLGVRRQAAHQGRQRRTRSCR